MAGMKAESGSEDYIEEDYIQENMAEVDDSHAQKARNENIEIPGNMIGVFSVFFLFKFSKLFLVSLC